MTFMDKDYSNYDLFDRLIANERKAKSWTVFWITLLCIMAGVLLWAVISISEKNKTIKAQMETMKNQRDTISDREALIKSLQDDCGKSIAKFSDSLNREVDKTISSIAKMENSPAAGTEKNAEIAKSVKQLNVRFEQIKKEFQKEKPSLFIQYNNNSDQDKVNNLLNILKNKTEYLVLPPELVKRPYAYLIKCFNYQDPKQEEWLKKVMAKNLSIDPDAIKISHDSKPGKSQSIEIWIGSPDYKQVTKENIKAQLKS